MGDTFSCVQLPISMGKIRQSNRYFFMDASLIGNLDLDSVLFNNSTTELKQN